RVELPLGGAAVQPVHELAHRLRRLQEALLGLLHVRLPAEGTTVGRATPGPGHVLGELRLVAPQARCAVYVREQERETAVDRGEAGRRERDAAAGPSRQPGRQRGGGGRGGGRRYRIVERHDVRHRALTDS